MILFSQNRTILGIFLCLFILSGCASTKFTATWKSDQVTNALQAEKIFVWVVAEKLASRQATENEIVRMFESSGIDAKSSLTLLGPSFRPDSNKTEEIRQSLLQDGFDGALVLSVLDVEQSERYVQGSTYPTGFYGGYGWGYYYPYYGRVYEPGYYTTTTTVFLITDVYDLETKELLWTGQSESLDPSNLNSFVKQYSKSLRAQLKKEDVLVMK